MKHQVFVVCFLQASSLTKIINYFGVETTNSRPIFCCASHPSKSNRTSLPPPASLNQNNRHSHAIVLSIRITGQTRSAPSSPQKYSNTSYPSTHTDRPIPRHSTNTPSPSETKCLTNQPRTRSNISTTTTSITDWGAERSQDGVPATRQPSTNQYTPFQN